MRIATWNVNSVNARLPNVLEWLGAVQPDVVLLQEIKCEAHGFPAAAFEAAGYRAAVHGQKSYNGVAILSKLPIEEVSAGLAGDQQSRYIEATVGGLRVASIYLPNGNPVGTEKYAYKHEWLAWFRAHVAGLLREERPLVLGGDYNVIPADQDCYSPQVWAGDALFTPETRALYRAVLNLGLTDAFRALHPDERRAYTFWDYQAGRWMRGEGIRIDHVLLSPEAADRLTATWIDKEPRGRPKASDHTPMVVEVA